MAINYIFKIVIAGDTNTGKTAFCDVIQGNGFKQKTIPTIGIEFFSTMFSVDGQIIKTQMWDVSGDVKFRSILTPYFKSTCGIMLFYDVSEINSFHHLIDWINKFIKKDNKLPVIIIGNKTDKSRKISRSYAEGFAEEKDYYYEEMSVKNYDNVSETFAFFIKKIYEKKNNIDGVRKVLPGLIEIEEPYTSLNCGKCIIS
jgi:small GTP-binding protein